MNRRAMDWIMVLVVGCGLDQDAVSIAHSTDCRQSAYGISYPGKEALWFPTVNLPKNHAVVLPGA